MRQIEIEAVGRGKALADLDEKNPRIVDELYKRLPIDAIANLWGEEVYFDIPLETEDENPSAGSSKGDISYWSPGHAFCIFFGQSQPYSPVNHIGKIVEGLEMFEDVKTGDWIVLKAK